MALINRQQLIKLHTILATMIFPVALMFFITGALYSLHIEGDYKETSIPFKLPNNFQPRLISTKALMVTQLQNNHIALPTSEARFKQQGKNVRLSWGGADISAELNFKLGDNKATIKIYDADWYQRFARLHKADGGNSFKYYAVFMSIALLLLLISGFMMAWQVPKHKVLATRSTLVGILLFTVLFWIN